MHERYLFLILPFVLLLINYNKNNLIVFLIFSFLTFLNLYHSWPVPRIEFLLAFLSNNYVASTLSILNIVIFLKLLLDFTRLKPKER